MSSVHRVDECLTLEYRIPALPVAMDGRTEIDLGFFVGLWSRTDDETFDKWLEYRTLAGRRRQNHSGQSVYQSAKQQGCYFDAHHAFRFLREMEIRRDEEEREGRAPPPFGVSYCHIIISPHLSS